MIRKYGKTIDHSMINRDISGIKTLIGESEKSARKLSLSVKTKRDRCIACGSKSRELFLTVYDKYHYYECKNCGALTLEQFPDVESMYSSGDTENFGIYIDERTFENRMNLIAKPKADFVLEVLKDIGKPVHSWLDIGCGGGELLRYLERTKCGIKCIGLESDKAECDFTKKLNLDVRNKFIDTKQEDKEITSLLHEADIVSFFNVLEHIEEPLEYINYLYESMKIGAIMVIEVPKHPSLGSFANLTSKNNVYRHIVPPVHLQIFSEKSLEIMLKDKFDILATWEFGQGFMDVINNAMILSGTNSCDIYHKVVEVQNEVQQSIDKAGLADQILLIAKRKEIKEKSNSI